MQGTKTIKKKANFKRWCKTDSFTMS
jgi:hypothetical protein